MKDGLSLSNHFTVVIKLNTELCNAKRFMQLEKIISAAIDIVTVQYIGKSSANNFQVSFYLITLFPTMSQIQQRI